MLCHIIYGYIFSNFQIVVDYSIRLLADCYNFLYFIDCFILFLNACETTSLLICNFLYLIDGYTLNMFYENNTETSVKLIKNLE